MKNIFHIHQYKLKGYYEFYKDNVGKNPNNAITVLECKCEKKKFRNYCLCPPKEDSTFVLIEKSVINVNKLKLPNA